MKRPLGALCLLAAASAVLAQDVAPSSITVDEASARARALRARVEAAVPASPAAPPLADVPVSPLAVVPPPQAQDQGQQLLAAGHELLAEMEALHRSLEGIQDLIRAADLPAEDALVSRTVKLVRRVRSLVHASHAPDERRNRADPRWRDDEARRLRQRRRRRAKRIEERKMMQTNLRAGGIGIGSGEVEEVMDRQDALLAEQEEEALAALEQEEEAGRELELVEGGQEGDAVARKLADTTITFPECKELFLDACIEILNEQMVDLSMDLQIVVHEKRALHQDGYYKVVLVTDLTGTRVKGRLQDGVVSYPFLWDDAVTGYARQLGVNGQWDCHGKSPEECCAEIQASCPNPDTRGNHLQCHIFVPFGGVGNKKRDDRVFVNLSPDGRVQEAPFVA